MHIGDILADGTIRTGSARFLFEEWTVGPLWDPSEVPPRRIEAPFDPDVPEIMPGMAVEPFVGGMTFGFEASLSDAETLELFAVLPIPGSWTGQDIRGDLGLGAYGTAPGVTLYSVSAGEILTVLQEPGSYSPSTAFSSDGSRLVVVGLDRNLYMYDVTTWELLGLDALASDENVRALAFHPDGTRLITIENTGDLVIRYPTTLEPRSRLAGSGQPLVADSETFFFDGSGRYLLTSGGASAILWDLDEEALVGVPFANDPDFRIGGRNGPELLTAVGDWLKLWNLDLQTWPEIACQAAGRNLTLAEWQQFGPAGEPYNATCAQWPAAQ